jgi:hypothetical protein
MCHSQVLNRIRKMMYRFLWSGCGESERIHLCKWEDLSKPKVYGGWGFKHLNWFNKALAANTLWRCLMKDGLWHRVIMDKYFHSQSVASWLRRPSRAHQKPQTPGGASTKLFMWWLIGLHGGLAQGCWFVLEKMQFWGWVSAPFYQVDSSSL